MENTWPVIGHGKIIEFLQRSIKNDKIAHTYLFYGPEKVGKFRVALEFAKTLECEKRSSENYAPCGVCPACRKIESQTHPDIMIIEAANRKTETKNYEKKIGIEEVRLIRHHLSLFSHSAPYKIVIVNGAEKLSKDAANSFLKTLEEPTPKSVIILITSAASEMLPTIISRSQPLKFLPVATKEIADSFAEGKLKLEDPELNLDAILNFSAGKPGLAIDIAKDPSIYRKKQKTIDRIIEIINSDISVSYAYAAEMSKDTVETQNTLKDWTLFFRDLMLIKENCRELLVFKNNLEAFRQIASRYTVSRLKTAILKIEEAQGLLANSSFNAKLILEVLFLSI